MKTTIRTLTAFAAALVLGACSAGGAGPSDDATASQAATVEDAATEEAATRADAGEATVDIDDFAYRPGTLTVTAGTEVTWTNVDAVLHSVTAGTPDAPQPGTFDLDPIDAEGQTVSHTFGESGTFEYFCRYHDFMRATVEVTP